MKPPAGPAHVDQTSVALKEIYQPFSVCVSTTPKVNECVVSNAKTHVVATTAWIAQPKDYFTKEPKQRKFISFYLLRQCPRVL